ncbi:DNA mismatch repair endonuclease MutL [Paenibacillus sediminis]|uniref:DNA mismatch repair protein MutL n=1 Tax=Paenibacillus sediminis TaxID=664909 RepID=A0ABS4H032_9BACL|nr:DNA mismatch repair endonuclease MutL [Paenibacillus sediminis]MBP1935879.1 DNA mismatch repair protein MutL [Paenibacillus sediminis]
MGKIHVLDEHIANQIAAGEVVERPASVVKELIENSVDAGSTRIDVYVEEGGLQLIRVVDNGLGIDPEDCETAFYRHATSKIAHGRDLFQIRSLGFRGEALPSIAAVSKVQLISSNNDDGMGRRIVIEGGTFKVNEDIAAPRGTDFTVQELFYNTPARLKYMKTVQTELGHISDVLYRMALAHPEIAFTLRHNGNMLLQTVGGGDLLQVIAAIYGTSSAKAMLPIEGESLDYKISGYISRPDLTRSNRNAMSTIINGRYIRNHGLNQAILRAFHTLLPINRYPLIVLQLEMHPSLVDVNVHPAKLEVRFSKESELNEFVENCIRSLLKQQVLIPQVMNQPIGKGNNKAFIQEQFHFAKPEVSVSENVSSLTKENSWTQQSELTEAPIERNNSYQQSAASSSQTGPNWNDRNEGNLRSNDRTSWSGQTVREQAPASMYRTSAAPSPEQLYGTGQEMPELPAFPQLTLIGQHHGTYLIAQNDEGLFLIDQHAAHERVNYEYYYEKFGKPEEASQELLLPITLEFTPSDAEKLKTRLHWFEQVGVYLEHFGGQTFRVISYPYWFPQGAEAELIEEMAEWVLQEKVIDLAKLREKSSTLVSCKASIKANQKITMQEAEVLLERLAACKQPYTCPHGRPIVVSFSSYDLEKMFKRVM